MTDKEIEVIKARADAATGGPWVYSPDRHTGDYCIHRQHAREEYDSISHDDGVIGSSEWIWINDSDGDFIAHARQDIPALLADREALLKRIKGLERI